MHNNIDFRRLRNNLYYNIHTTFSKTITIVLTKIKESMTLQLIFAIIITGVFHLNFLHNIVYLGEFILTPDLRVVLNSDNSVNAANTFPQESVVRDTP